MSADLLAAFGHSSDTQSQADADAHDAQRPTWHLQHHVTAWPDFSHPDPSHAVVAPPAPILGGTEDEDDDWGDFEVAPQAEKPLPGLPFPPLRTDTTATFSTSTTDHPPPAKPDELWQRTRVLRATTLDLLSNQLVDVAASGEKQGPWPGQKPRIESSDPNVLFDANILDGDHGGPDDDDDFGDFASVSSQPESLGSKGLCEPATDAAQSHDACGDRVHLDGNAELATAQARKPPDLGLVTPKDAQFPRPVKHKSSSPTTAWPGARGSAVHVKAGRVVADDDAEVELASAYDIKSNTVVTPGWDGKEWMDADTPQSTVVSTSKKQERDSREAPPTNIPPPAILLSVFPDLLATVEDALFTPLGSGDPGLKAKVFSDAATVTFLRGYLALATVAARIMAGRKLRWHRDKFLAQGMSISTAGSRGGMKLAGIDKAQSIREDREATDLVAAFRDKIGRLRGAVATVNAAITKDGSRPLRVPELSETVAVQSAKNVVSAPKPCVICGLKREERVPKVDFDVEDSFGEWWVEFWGHRSCRNFWLEHEVRLRQR